MAVRIRLSRFGKKNDPRYRVAVMDKRKPRDGAAIEYIGYYNPTTDPSTVKIDKKRYNYWISKGAQPSETVRSLYKNA